MRRCVLVALLFAVVLAGSTAPRSASAEANLTMFIFSDCTHQFGEPARIQYNSSSDCHPSLPDSTTSFRFACLTNGTNAHFSFQLYDDTDCSGSLTEMIDVKGQMGQCILTTTALQGEQIPFYANFSCSMSEQDEVASLNQLNTRTAAHRTLQHPLQTDRGTD